MSLGVQRPELLSNSIPLCLNCYQVAARAGRKLDRERTVQAGTAPAAMAKERREKAANGEDSAAKKEKKRSRHEGEDVFNGVSEASRCSRALSAPPQAHWSARRDAVPATLLAGRGATGEEAPEEREGEIPAAQFTGTPCRPSSSSLCKAGCLAATQAPVTSPPPLSWPSV